jgi:signal-transduction protein with cAMP-binding, CBS, and nucleotidyltransferase domain
MEMTMKKGEEFNYFYLIKSGTVKVFGDGFTYMYELKAGGFFGEFNILFNILSQQYYKTTLVRNCGTDHQHIKQTVLFKIEAEAFMNAVC